MLTSPRTNVTDSFVPGHHLALITQPVLGARSRSRKKTNIIVETSTSSKEKLDLMTNSRRSSYNDSPPLILPINRIDTSQYQKKNNPTNHQDSSDSGIDLSLSTNSSVQFQQYSQQHFQNHRPLSALNEDSCPDDGYHDEHQQGPIDAVRLRCPPINFGRNRSMENMISSNKCEEQQHRSSSFSDETQQKLSSQHEKKMKRSSDGALLDLIDGSSESTEPYRRTISMKNELFYPLNTQQHRSLNDLTNKTFSKVTRDELNMPMIDDNSPTSHTVIRKPNMSVVKPSRKKTKLNVVMEPSCPLVSSRLTVYEAQINTMTGANSSSSNQTTPRSIRPLGQQQQQQQQVKLKAKTQLSHYPNPEQIRAHVNRSVLERQHPTNLVVPIGRGAIQQILPFDASPSKYNNLLLRHYIQQQQANTAYHSSSNTQLSPSRQVKQALTALYTEENTANYQDEKRKQKEQVKIRKPKEYAERKRCKQKENFENHLSNSIYEKQYEKTQMKDTQASIPFKSIYKREKSQDTFEKVITQRHQIDSIQRQQEKDPSYEKNQQRNRFMKNRLPDENESTNERQHMENVLTITPRRQYEQQSDSQSRGSFINDTNRNSIADKYESIQSNNPTGNIQCTNFMHRRQQKPLEYVDGSLHVNQYNHIHRDIDAQQQNHGSKPQAVYLRNKTHNDSIEKGLIQTTGSNSQYRSDYFHGSKKKPLVPSQSRPSKIHFSTYDNSTNPFSLIETQNDQNRHQHKWRNSSYENDPLEKIQNRSKSKITQIKAIFPKNENVHELKREREISQLSYVPKEDSEQYDETKFNQKNIEKNLINSCQTTSPVSVSTTSEHYNGQQHLEIYEKINVYERTLATLPLFHEKLTEDDSITHSPDYPISHNDKKQLFGGRYVIPSNNLHTPTVIDRSSHPSSCHTYPFTCTNDIENKNDTLIDDYSMAMKTKSYKSSETNIYVLSERDSTNDTIEVRNPSSHSENFSPNKKMYSPPEKVELSIEKKGIISNDDSDDGWSDDSAELLYVDERYAMEQRKITSSSHLSSDEPYQYQVQQQNVLLQ